MSTRITLQDDRLRGGRSIAEVDSDTVAVACADARRIVIVDPSTATIAGASAVLADEPRVVLYDSTNTKLWAITLGGSILRLSTADTPILSGATLALDSPIGGPQWLTLCNGKLVAPIGDDGVVTLSTTPAVLDQHDGVLPRIAFAIGSSDGYLYAFDGRGTMAVFTVSTAGAIAYLTRIAVGDLVGPLSGFIDDDSLVIACERRALVLEYDLSDPAEPVEIDRNRYLGYTLRGALNDVTRLPLTDEPFADLGLAEWWPIRCGLLTADDIPLYVHEQSGRVTMVLGNIGLTVNAGNDVSQSSMTYVLQGSGNDPDGGPLPIAFTWSQISGPGTAAFVDVTDPTTSVTVDVQGVYVLQLSGTDGVSTATDTVQLTLISYFILQEDSFLILTEAGNTLAQE